VKSDRPRAPYQSVHSSVVFGNVNQTMNGRPRWLLIALVVIAILAVIILILVSLFYDDHNRKTTSSATIRPNQDIRMQEVWASSSENVHKELRDRQWAATDFPVTQPFLRSVEVAAGPPGVKKVQLIVYDPQMQEVASCENPINADWRVKCIFDDPIDIHFYLGQHLYLLVKNIVRQPIRTYLTKNDRDRSVTSYLSCGQPKLIECPNPHPQDLDVLIFGRATRN
jgi:hypothetical protein